jgi:HD-GYP domain-containing protein (c-di-GMP phosphodiesterase class II)
MENSYTETSPLFSYTTNNNKNSNNGVAATINRLQKESFTTSLTQIIDAVSEEQPNETETKVTEEIEEIKNSEIDPVPLTPTTAHEQRRTLLDALIKALTNFTSQFSEEEDAEVVSAVIKSHLRRFHSSRSYECLRSESHENTIRTSATHHNFVSNKLSQEIRENPMELVPFLSPSSAIKSPESYHTSSEQESSTSERMNAIKNSQTWQQWSNLKNNELAKGESTRDSITMLLAENSDDDEDVIYL